MTGFIVDENGKEVRCTVLYMFPVLWRGWEMDNEAWIVRTNDNKVRCVMTNHGKRIFAKESDLHERLTEYKKAMKGTKGAIHLLQGVLK